MNFELTEVEKQHPLWNKVKGHLEDQLRLHRERNDKEDYTREDARVTAFRRGRIAQLKELLALGEPKKAVPD